MPLGPVAPFGPCAPTATRVDPDAHFLLLTNANTPAEDAHACRPGVGAAAAETENAPTTPTSNPVRPMTTDRFRDIVTPLNGRPEWRARW